MEHGPAVPDVLIENAPDSKAKEEDLQLKKAVDVLLAEMKQGQEQESSSSANFNCQPDGYAG